MNTIYLARLELGSYLLQAVGQTEGEAITAIRREWQAAKKSRNMATFGRDWEDYSEHFGLWVAPMTLGKAEYH